MWRRAVWWNVSPRLTSKHLGPLPSSFILFVTGDTICELFSASNTWFTLALYKFPFLCDPGVFGRVRLCPACQHWGLHCESYFWMNLLLIFLMTTCILYVPEVCTFWLALVAQWRTLWGGAGGCIILGGREEGTAIWALPVPAHPLNVSEATRTYGEYGWAEAALSPEWSRTPVQPSIHPTPQIGWSWVGSWTIFGFVYRGQAELLQLPAWPLNASEAAHI